MLIWSSRTGAYKIDNLSANYKCNRMKVLRRYKNILSFVGSASNSMVFSAGAANRQLWAGGGLGVI